MGGTPGASGTHLPAVRARWGAGETRRGLGAVAGLLGPEPTGKRPGIPGSLRTGPLPAGGGPAGSEASWAPLRWMVFEDRSLWAGGL